MTDIDLKFYFAILRRKLSFIFVVWALVSGLALAFALLLPPVYQSTASILVESQKISEELVQSTVDISALEQIQVIQQQLMTRANLLQIADEFGIFKDQPDLTPTDIVTRMTDATEFSQAQLGSTRNSPGAIIFELSFQADDAALVARVANELATLILEQNVRIRTGRASETMLFFQNSVTELGTELSQLESEILDFKNANADSLPDSLEFRRDQVTILQERLLQLERDEVALQESRASLELALETSNGETALVDQTTRNQQALTELRSDLAEQLAIYSETNPSIIAMKARVTALEKLVSDEAASTVNVSGEVPSTLSGRLDQVKARLTTTGQQRQAIDTEVARLLASIDKTPTNEIKLNSLERSYENVRGQFADAQQKMSEAAIGEQLELRQKGERFELIEQPNVPDQPISPNRKLIGVGGSVAGLLLALGIVVLLEMLNHSVRRPIDLVRKLDLHPIASIPYVETRGEVMRGRLATTSWIIALAGGIPATLYFVHYYYMPLDLLLQQTAKETGLAGLLSQLLG